MNQQQVTVPVGIDLGSFTSKIAVAKRGGVQVITNQANFRQTPCVVGYGPNERQIGEAGHIKIKSNWKDTVAYPARFLGLRSDYPFLRAQKKFCPCKCAPKGDKIAFDVKYQGQPQSLYPEQIFAAYLNKLKLILNKNNFDSKTAVVAVPTYFTQQQRRALLDAARIAELGITRVLNESTAIALDYGIFRKKDLHAQNARNVLFIDFGHSKLSIFLCSFTSGEMNVLEQEHCRHIGCRDIDYHLLQFYRGIFQKSSGCDLTENKKAVLKVMQNIEKQRKVLTGNRQNEINIECLMEDEDLRYNMTRQQFEQISQPIFAAINEAMNKIKTTIQNKKHDVHSIELIGGGSRIPAFINIVKDCFGMEPSRTLNSSQSVARGCALMAAIKSPLFRVADYTLNERVYYAIKFSWNFVEGQKYLGLDSSLYPEKQSKFIYDVGAKIPTSKTVKFQRKQAIEILIEYEPQVNGFNKHIGYFVTKPQTPKEDTFGVSFKIKYNEHGLVTFEECNLVEEWFEETKIPKKKKEEKKDAKKEEGKEGQPEKMDVEEQFQIKKTKKQKHTQVKYEANTFDAFTSKDLQNFFTVQSTMLNQDKIIIETYERKNELESMIYSWKERILGSHKEYTKNQQAAQILPFLEAQKQWLYNDGSNATRGVYTERITAIKNKVANIVKRYENFQSTVFELQNLEASLKTNVEKLNSLDKKYEHISPEERQEGYNSINKAREWAIDADEKQKNIPKYEPLAITANDVKNQIKEVNEKVKKIMAKPPPPPPPKEQKKAEDPAQPQAAPQAKPEEKMEAEGKAGQPEKMDVQ